MARSSLATRTACCATLQADFAHWPPAHFFTATTSFEQVAALHAEVVKVEVLHVEMAQVDFEQAELGHSASVEHCSTTCVPGNHFSVLKVSSPPLAVMLAWTAHFRPWQISIETV